MGVIKCQTGSLEETIFCKNRLLILKFYGVAIDRLHCFAV